jgi:transposase InsO family protein
MKKEEIRKEFFKLKNKGHSYSQCKIILKAKHNYEITIRTLKRWINKLDSDNLWDLSDKSRRPKTIYKKINNKIEKEVINLRKKTGWGAGKLKYHINEISETSIRRVLERYNLTNHPKRRKKRLKYTRFERDHSNTMWQIDHSDQKIEDKWLISIIDDHSRYSIGLITVNRVTTQAVVQILDELAKIHGYPRQILSDNGSAYGLKSKHSKFDRWCRRRGIQHIRSAVHSPTTCGKVERLFQTIKKELPFCKDINDFRMRYNHFRKHTSLFGKTPAEVYFDFQNHFRW